MTVTEEQKFKILQNMSGNFFTTPIPDNWEDMDNTWKIHWMTANAKSTLNFKDVHYVWQQCDNGTTSMIAELELGTF